MKGQEIVRSGKTSGGPVYASDTFDKLVEDRERTPPVFQTSSGRLVTLNPLFVGLPRSGNGRGLARTMPGVGVVEIAIYLGGVSTRFGPLRRNLIVGVSAGFALLISVIVIGFRFRTICGANRWKSNLQWRGWCSSTCCPLRSLLTRDLEFAARCVPAWQVGGDFYDAFETDDHQTVLILGDVSGKGLRALLMGVVQGLERDASNATGPSIHHEQSADRLNQLLVRRRRASGS